MLGSLTDLNDLLAQVDDEGLRSQLQSGIDLLTRQMRFGLVFERHIPESVRVYSAEPRVGDLVQIRAETSGEEFTIQKLTTHMATIESTTTSEQHLVKPREIVVVKRFGDPVYPALHPTGSIRRSDDRPAHAAICGENFHTLQLLKYLYRGRVDCIYIDPPYNTGDPDWKYNNRYVDSNDKWMHSKWLSFMEKRLEIAKDLLRPDDGVLVVTIDEHEVHHLGVLLEQVFREYEIYTISIVHNPKGKSDANVSRVNEFALICVPKVEGRRGRRAVEVFGGLPPDEAEAMVGKRTAEHADQDDIDEDGELDGDEIGDEAIDDDVEIAELELPFPPEEIADWELRHGRRRGDQSSYRHQRHKQFYPLYIDREARKVVRAGDYIALDEEPDFDDVDGLAALWPIDADGNDRVWRFSPETMQARIDDGRVVLGKQSEDGRSWTVNVWYRKNQRKKYKSVWWNPKHDAGTHGTHLIHKMLERRNVFPFAKSLYAVRDTLMAVVRDRPEALILDFFAGSGTTLHATALINAQDDGRRQCIVVSNNEVSAKTAAELRKKKLLPGDTRYEKHGIFQDVTRQRIQAALTGETPGGKPHSPKNTYIDGRPWADGFDENVEFFDLVYLDRDEVSQGSHFSDIEPSLWLMAGGVGILAKSDEHEPYALASHSNYAVLFDRSRFAEFRKRLDERADITHVFLITDSQSDYHAMCRRLDDRFVTSMLYRDYLSNFRINTVEAWR